MQIVPPHLTKLLLQELNKSKSIVITWAFLVTQGVKNLPVMQETKTLDQEDPQEETMAIHSSILAWRIPWPGEPGGLQSVGSQRVGPD